MRSQKNIHFKSEVDRLGWLIRTIKRRFAHCVCSTPLSADETEVLVISGTLVRLAGSYAEGIYALLVKKFFDAALPIERSLEEIWCDFRYLMRFGSPAENARKLQINACLELSEFFVDPVGEAIGDPGSASIAKVKNYWAKNHPDLLRLVREQRRSRIYHWSGLSRTELHRKVGGKAETEIYKILSWETHGVMTAIRDLEITLGCNTHHVVFKPLKKSEDAVEEAAYRTSGTLFHLWNEYAEKFGLRTIKSPHK